MKRHIRQTALVLLTAVLLVAGAFVTMIVGYAQEYYTVQIDYLFENGEKAHDPFIAVFEKGDADSPVIMDRTVTNPIIQGYKAVDSLDQDTQQPAPTFKLQGELTENREYKIYYVPVEVPYKVKYYLQNAYDDDYTESITLPGPYYNKMGLTGEKPGFPDELDSDENFSGFTRQSHDYEFIAADGSTEYEVYFNRNYYLINLDLNGGFGVDSVYAKYNTPFTMAKPQKEGYLFAGWAPCNKDGNFVDDQGNEISEDQAINYADPFTSGVVPNEDRYYKAVWKAELVDYSIVYYALFKMNTVPYTLNYVYQGRRGGNNGNNYSGDDAEYDEKIYSVTVDLKPGAWTEDKTSFAQTLVDYAPDIDDLYKDCVWVINDSHVTVDDANHTVTITAVQKPKLCTVEFFLNNSTLLKIERVSLNSWVTQEDGKFVEAPEKDGDNPFAYWSVKEKSTGKEISRCFDRAFDLRVTGDITVTACYSAEAQRIFIGNPSYSREQTTDAGGKVTDKLYADFILAYMEKNGKLLNPNYDNRVSDEYKTGVIVEYDQNKMLTKPDAAGATLSDDDKKEVVYESNDVLNKEDAKKLVNNEAVSLNHRYFCFAVANDKYNNHNRVDRVITFINSPTARHLVLRAYYYVWNVTTGEFEMTEPVYFYLYDIGNSVSEANSQ